MIQLILGCHNYIMLSLTYALCISGRKLTVVARNLGSSDLQLT